MGVTPETTILTNNVPDITPVPLFELSYMNSYENEQEALINIKK